MRARCWLLVLCLTACADAPAPAPVAALSGDVVAVVNGRAILREALLAHARETGQAPKAALKQLVRERILADYAAAHGYERAPSVRLGVERARVRALLAREVEQKVPESDVAGRARRLEELLTELRSRTPVQFDPVGVTHALAAASR